MYEGLKKYITLRAPDWFFIPLINLNNRLKNRKVSVRKYEPNIYAIHDGEDTVYMCRRSRLRRHFFGVKAQCSNLCREYMIHDVPLEVGDVLVDCGANNGEIGMWARRNGLTYHAFEPEPLEARCCDLNNYRGEKKTIRKGLWYEKTTLRWYSKPEDADSSLIEIDNPVDVRSVETTTLDDFVRENGIDRIRLLKLEAEGAEPEVLRGALGVLNKIDYITVDCGYERGLEKRHTFIEVYNILKDHQFDIVASEFKRVVFLFKRQEV